MQLLFKLNIFAINEFSYKCIHSDVISCYIMDSDDDYYENDFDDDESDLSDDGYLGESNRVETEGDHGHEEEFFPYKCVSTDEVVSLMNESIAEVNEIVNVGNCSTHMDVYL